jgi:glyceraldehyde 3-phosphate dehydrogenase
VDLTIEAERETSPEEINDAMRGAAGNRLVGVLGVTDHKLVSMDFNHDPRSSILATDQTKVLEGRMVRVLSWYDNEWGFSNRMADVAVAMAKHI